MISFLKLIRYKNLLMVLLTMVLTKYALIRSLLDLITHFDFAIIVLSVLLITSGGYIINDIYDVSIDKINKPQKVYVGNSISFKNAWISYFTLTIVGVLLGIYVSYNYHYSHSYSFYFIFSALGLFLYSKYLKGLPLIGNLLISLLVGLSIYIISLFELPEGGLFVLISHLESLRSDVLFYVQFAFFTTLIREIIKDIEDIDGDYKAGIKTLPILIGSKRAKNVIIIITAIVLVFFIREINYDLLNNRSIFNYSFLLLLVLFLYFFYRLWKTNTKKEFRFLSNLMKVIMLSGILSMIFY
tara:strand:+ start:1965 stop:2861 length:897 start_codon:yes stop_codon:yes gene_type:complete